ncbi:MAG: hypothetical protein A2086_00440 [Spirochaetes bacterium GWD1_27_9]|nr:MAG: hypothetical protein A2Z98_13540 [Spirochaetes bacterium GWB1_27_13]OHD25571.1 MAG: hypothetical protein A2Y34_06870 [Spirochaetes bacterium GWC1_27_15]OHD43923.1 MAG: hypothetical protein A2086_00440 [Spirochaetes bacterium GWD1_27_9]
MEANEVIKLLNLVPHPEEGGFFIETYRSSEFIAKESLPNRYDAKRSFGTCIYYFLTPETFSKIHKLKSDEIFHFYLGDPVEMVNLYQDGSGQMLTIGNDIKNGMLPQVIVKKDIWQGARLKDGGKFALLGTTVAPSFEFIDYETGKRDFLLKNYPNFKDIIVKLTSE